MQTNKLKQSALSAERPLIISALQKFQYNKTKAAAHLGIDRNTLYNKLKLIPRISQSSEFYSENYLRSKEAELLEQLIHVRALLKLWEKKESNDNLHPQLRNEGEHIVLRERNDFRKTVTKRTRKSKHDDWSSRYVPSNNALHKRLRTSLLDQPIE